MTVMMITTTLNTGRMMPLIGLGTFKIRGYELVEKTLDAALSHGYRSFDTAAVYGNEQDIGKALKKLLPIHGLERRDIFITSKLGPKDQGTVKCREACLRSLDSLGVDHLDLYLIHWPGTQGMSPEDPRHPDLRKESWAQMEHLQCQGKIRSIGVSNYTLRHMKELLMLCSVKPAVLQIEHHPHLNQLELVEYCRQHAIHFQAYSSLGSTSHSSKLLKDVMVCEIAHKFSKSPAQVLLKWAVQQNIGVLPKSTSPDHIKENIDISDFELSAEDMEKLNSLSAGEHYCWDPQKVT